MSLSAKQVRFITEMESVYCAVRTDYIIQCKVTSKQAVPWFRWLVAVLWKPRPGFGSKTLYLGYIVDKMWHCNKLFSQYFGSTLSVLFRPRSILIFSCVARTRRTEVHSLETFKKVRWVKCLVTKHIKNFIKTHRLSSAITLPITSVLMRLNVQCHTLVTFSPRKRGGAHYTEGLMNPTPSLLLLTDCCIHHERVDEMKKQNEKCK
jgi:hypothetical protein